MIKKVVYCRKFEFADKVMAGMMGNHPRPGYLYKMYIDDMGHKRVIIPTKDGDRSLYLSDLKAEDLRYRFDFKEFTPSIIFEEMRIPQALNPSEIEEWIDKEDSDVDTTNYLGITEEPEEEPEEKDKYDSLFLKDILFIQGFIEDLREFYPDVYNGFMNATVGVNNLLASQKDVELQVTEDKLAELLSNINNDSSLEDFSLLQLAIISKFNKQG